MKRIHTMQTMYTAAVTGGTITFSWPDKNLLPECSSFFPASLLTVDPPDGLKAVFFQYQP